MVNKTALEAIYSYIEIENLRPMKPWSLRQRYDRGGNPLRYIRELIKKIKAILNLLSGGDVGEMLKGNFITKNNNYIIFSSKKTYFHKNKGTS